MEGGATERLSESITGTRTDIESITGTRTDIAGEVAAVTDDDVEKNKRVDLPELYDTLVTKIDANCQGKDCCIYTENVQDFQILDTKNGWIYKPDEKKDVIQLYFKHKTGKHKEEGQGELHLWKKVVIQSEV